MEALFPGKDALLPNVPFSLWPDAGDMDKGVFQQLDSLVLAPAPCTLTHSADF